MKQVYINSAVAISAQETFENEGFLEEVKRYEENILAALNPKYTDFIPRAAARRMAKGIKMGVVAGKQAVANADVAQLDGIITGTGMGCLIESEKFVSAIIDNDEQYLTPTPFIQSTHNTVAGQIALAMQCNAYNFTYVHGATSFESSLLDASMMLASNEGQQVLIGGVDEIGKHTYTLYQLLGHIKPENIQSDRLYESNTSGSIFGEGASFFVLSNIQQDNSYARVVGMDMWNTLSQETLDETMADFVRSHQMKLADIDLMVLGKNGDVTFDSWYDTLMQGQLANTPALAYKHLSGEYFTASSFGFWTAVQVLKRQEVPKSLLLQGKPPTAIKNILLYNQYRGKYHSVVLLQTC
ncbi:MAG: beta-ketoacyl synthase chain length factor [Flavobacteriaceae bacterium]|nr:beta-ketoacyl synthase chain length factor [Flavobacteriaceae bacterium]